MMDGMHSSNQKQQPNNTTMGDCQDIPSTFTQGGQTYSSAAHFSLDQQQQSSFNNTPTTTTTKATQAQQHQHNQQQHLPQDYSAQASQHDEEAPMDGDGDQATNSSDYGADSSSEFINSRKADDHKNKGNAHIYSKEYEKAVYHYTEAITICPTGQNSHVYFSNRANAYCYLGRYNDAANDCIHSIELNPVYEKAHARLGLSCFFMGNYQGAVDAYERAIELDHKSTASLSYLGKARTRLADQKKKEKQKQQQRNQEQLQHEMKHKDVN